MIMSPGVRKFALTAHVTASVGWIGAVAAFLAIAIIGLTSQDDRTVRGAYLVMEPAARLVLVPLAWASLVTGLVQSLGTTWGLFRHYWVLFKLVINLVATLVLLNYMATFRHMAATAANPTADLDAVRSASPVLHATLALVVLLVATVLAIYKPRGVTWYGWRKQREERNVMTAKQASLVVCLVALLLGVFGRSTVLAQHGPGRHRADSVQSRGPAYDIRNEVTVRGSVVAVKAGAHGPGEPKSDLDTHVLLKSDTDTVAIHLGPTAFLEMNRVVMRNGDTLRVTGSRAVVGESHVILAREVRSSTNVWTLRDATGQPLWSAQQTEKRGFWTKKRVLIGALAAKALVVTVMLLI